MKYNFLNTRWSYVQSPKKKRVGGIIYFVYLLVVLAIIN